MSHRRAAFGSAHARESACAARPVPDHARRARHRSACWRACSRCWPFAALPAIPQQDRRCRAAPRSRPPRCAPLCRAAGVPLIVNDDARLAAAVGADGVHLGEHDGGVAAARALLGRRRDHRRLLLRRPARARARRRRRRRLRRVRRVLPLADQAQRAPRDARRCCAQRARAGRAAGGDRRHHAGQCASRSSPPAPT